MTARIDSAPEVLTSRSLRELLLAGEPVDKTRIIRSASIDFLAHTHIASMTRDELVTALYRHTAMWITFARHATGRTLAYKGITCEQAALLLIYRHGAVSAPGDAIPPHWQHSSDASSKPQRHLSRVVAVYIDSDHGRSRQIPERFTPGFVTWPLEIDALILRYRPEADSRDRKRVHKLLRLWAPRLESPPTTALPTTALPTAH